MDGDDAGKTSIRNARRKADLLDDRVDSFRHNLEALRRWVESGLDYL
jgi:hypothetical protein